MQRPRQAYLLKKFPRLSETFVLNEILGQERLGADLHVFSRRPPDDEPRHAELAQLRASVEVMPSSKEIDPWEILLSQEAEDENLLGKIREVMSRVRPLQHPRLPSLLAEALFLRRRCRELGIAHVHAHFATDSAVVAMLSRELGGPSFSVTAHAKDIYRSTVQPALLAALLESSSFIVTVCDANVAHVESMVGPHAARKLRRLYNGIDRASFARSERPREPRHVLSVGRLVEKKGFNVLVDSFRQLAERGVEFSATIAGDGEDRAVIEERVRAHGLAGRVQFTGAVDQSRVRELYARAAVFALPCVIGADGNRDALPTVLLEAQAAGVPIVSTPVTGIPEILDGGRAGLLVPENDAAATADAIARLLDERDVAERLASRGLAHGAERFDGAANARVLRQWFDAAVEGAARACASST